MKKSEGRNIATSFTAGSFLVIAFTGVFLYFHLYENSIKNLHEILGLFFVIAVLLHIYFNWNSMKTYFKKKIFLVATLIITLISIGFIFDANSNESINPKKMIIDYVLDAPLSQSTQLFNIKLETAYNKLEKEGINTQKNGSINEIATTNKISPFKVLEIITSK